MTDLTIIGGGPAGLTAAIYALRYKLDINILSKDIGGLAATAHKVCNYPGFKEINGLELMQKFYQQVQKLGGEIIFDQVNKIKKNKNLFELETETGSFYRSPYIIFATGTKHRHLGIPEEKNLIGKGISYCATCDAAFFTDKVVGVVGGGDAALTAALLLTEYAQKVYIIYRRDHFFRGDPTWIEAVSKNKKIEPLFKEQIEALKGEKKLEKLILSSGKSLSIDGLFIEIGSEPDSRIPHSLNVKVSPQGYILTDDKQQTNIAGFFAAGDITVSPLKQIITAAGQGATAAYTVFHLANRDK